MSARYVAAALCLMPLTACATMEPEPCTQAWIEYKTDKVLRKFASENRSLLNDLRRLVDEDGDVSAFAALSLSRKSDQIQQLADSFNTVVLPEIESALDRCGTHEEFGPAFTNFLRSEGVKDEAIEWIVPLVALMQDMRSADPAPLPRT